jgi:hypothetical protein
MLYDHQAKIRCIEFPQPFLSGMSSKKGTHLRATFAAPWVETLYLAQLAPTPSARSDAAMAFFIDSHQPASHL